MTMLKIGFGKNRRWLSPHARAPAAPSHSPRRATRAILVGGAAKRAGLPRGSNDGEPPMSLVTALPGSKHERR
jgi:hypothetical protein